MAHPACWTRANAARSRMRSTFVIAVGYPTRYKPGVAKVSCLIEAVAGIVWSAGKGGLKRRLRLCDRGAGGRRRSKHDGPRTATDADERTRTSTSVSSRRPERRASTNSATSASASTLAFVAPASARRAFVRCPNATKDSTSFATVGARRAPLSSRGLGRRPLTAETGVRIPVAVSDWPHACGAFRVSGPDIVHSLTRERRSGDHDRSRRRVTRRLGDLLTSQPRSGLMFAGRRDDKNAMEVLARSGVRVLLWVTIAVPAAWAMLWVFERLLLAGMFGVELAASIWFYVAWLVVALVAGNAVAYGCDRVFLRRRARSRPISHTAGGS